MDTEELMTMTDVLDLSTIVPKKRFLIETLTHSMWADICYGAIAPNTICYAGNVGIDGKMIYSKVVGGEILIHDFEFTGPDGNKLTLEEYDKHVGKLTNEYVANLGQKPEPTVDAM
jgi:hypothetical protein